MGRCWKRGIGCLSTKIVLEVDSLDSCGMVLVVATKGVKGGTVEAAPAIGIATTASCLALGGRCARAAVWGSGRERSKCCSIVALPCVTSGIDCSGRMVGKRTLERAGSIWVVKMGGWVHTCVVSVGACVIAALLLARGLINCGIVGIGSAYSGGIMGLRVVV